MRIPGYSLASQVRKVVQICMLLSIALLGVSVGIAEKLRWQLPGWVPGVEHVTLILVSLLAFDLFLEHMEINERLSALESGEVQNLLCGLPDIRRKTVIDAIKNYVQLFHLVGKSKRYNPNFGAFAKRLLGEQVPGLADLAEGRYAASRDSIALVAGKLFAYYHESFHAASSDDLDFWLKPQQSKAYYDASRTAMQKHNTAVNRIFVLGAAEIRDRQEDLIEVLKHHQQDGIGWGVTVIDFLDESLTTGPLDFALMDEGKVLTYFREGEPRKSEALFMTPVTMDEILTQKRVYAGLVQGCVMMSSLFGQRFSLLRAARGGQRTATRGRRSIRVRKAVEPSIVAPAELIVATTLDEIPAAVAKLVVWVNEKTGTIPG